MMEERVISRQLKWQRKNMAQGLCRACGKVPCTQKKLCQLCADKVNQRHRINNRKKIGIPLDAPLYTRAIYKGKTKKEYKGIVYEKHKIKMKKYNRDRYRAKVGLPLDGPLYSRIKDKGK